MVRRGRGGAGGQRGDGEHRPDSVCGAACGGLRAGADPLPKDRRALPVRQDPGNRIRRADGVRQFHAGVGVGDRGGGSVGRVGSRRKPAVHVAGSGRTAGSGQPDGDLRLSAPGDAAACRFSAGRRQQPGGPVLSRRLGVLESRRRQHDGFGHCRHIRQAGGVPLLQPEISAGYFGGYWSGAGSGYRRIRASGIQPHRVYTGCFAARGAGASMRVGGEALPMSGGAASFPSTRPPSPRRLCRRGRCWGSLRFPR